MLIVAQGRTFRLSSPTLRGAGCVSGCFSGRLAGGAGAEEGTLVGGSGAGREALAGGGVAASDAGTLDEHSHSGAQGALAGALADVRLEDCEKTSGYPRSAPPRDKTSANPAARRKVSSGALGRLPREASSSKGGVEASPPSS